MTKKSLRYSVFVSAVLALALFSSFVSADLTASAINVTDNSTSLYDGGHFTVNWTAAGNDSAANYTIYLWMNDVHISTSLNGNTSAAGYKFTNATEANYTFTVEPIIAHNGTRGTNSTNISMFVDATKPGMTIALPAAGWKKGNFTLHINSTDILSNVTNATIGFGFENSTGNFSITLPASATTCNYASNATGFNCSRAFNTTVLADGNYTLWVNATDAVGNLGYSNVSVGIDSTGPTLTLSKSSSTQSSITVDYTSTDAGSGVANSTLSGSSGTFSGNKLGGVSCGTNYDVTITAYDGLGASSSSTVSMATSPCGSSFSSGGGGSGGGTSSGAHSFTTVTPGVASVKKYTDPELGLKEITLNVNNEAQNVKITVTKYEDKPAAVSVEKSGKVFQYLQIDVENIEDKLDSAVISAKVKKSWVSENGLGKEGVSMFKFDESSNQWNELQTSFSSEDDTYYYYTVELDSFSYFAISEKATVSNGENTDTGSGENVGSDNNDGDAGNSSGEDGNYSWVWVVVVLAILAAVGLGMKKKRT